MERYTSKDCASQVDVSENIFEAATQNNNKHLHS